MLDKSFKWCYNKDIERQREVKKMRQMDAKMTKGNFFRYYNKLNGADKYIIFFEYGPQVYKAIVSHIAPRWCNESRESYRYNKNGERKGGEQKWSMYLNNKEKELLIRKGAEPVFTVAELNTMFPETKNKGRKCEKWLHEVYNLGEHRNDIDRFDKGGDVCIDGVEYQVKFQNASLTNVRAIRNAQDARRKAKA